MWRGNELFKRGRHPRKPARIVSVWIQANVMYWWGSGRRRWACNLGTHENKENNSIVSRGTVFDREHSESPK